MDSLVQMHGIINALATKEIRSLNVCEQHKNKSKMTGLKKMYKMTNGKDFLQHSLNSSWFMANHEKGHCIFV